MAEKLKKAKATISPKSTQSTVPVTKVMVTTPMATITSTQALKTKKPVQETPKSTPVSMEAKTANRKRKQKFISTGVRGLNPSGKLYCVCKTPYDETK